MSVKLYEHQRKAVEQMHNGCVLWGDVGGGKTITSLAYYYEKVCGGTLGEMGSMKTPKDIYVITTAKKRNSYDWETDAAKLVISPKREFSDGEVQITVDSWNNLGKYRDVKNAFFVFDEQRAVGSGQWAKHFIRIAHANEWIMLSATPGDTWMDYIPLFLANGWYKNRAEFKQRHVIYAPYVKYPKILRYADVNRLEQLKAYLLVEMPFDRETTRHNETIFVDVDKDLLQKVVKDRWHVYEDRPLRDVSELFSVTKRVVFSDPSRLTAIRALMEKHPKLIVFYTHNYELDLLRTLANPPSSSTSETTGPFGSTSTAGPSETLCRTCETRSKTSKSSCGCVRAPRSTSDASHGLSNDRTSPTRCSDSSTARSQPPSANASLPSDTGTVISTSTLRSSSASATTESFHKALATSSAWPETVEVCDLSPTERPPGSTTTRSNGSERSHPLDRTTLSTSSSHTSTSQESPSTRTTTSTEKPSGTSTTASSTTSPTRSDERQTTSSSLTGRPSSSKTDSDSSRPTTWNPASHAGSGSSQPELVVAEYNGHNHDAIPTGPRWVYLVQYTAGAEGWNCTSTDAMAFFTLTYSYRAWHQSHGRIDRLNTPFRDLWYYKLVSDSWIDKAIWSALIDKRSFNEREYAINSIGK